MALQPLFFGWETDKLVFVVWQGRCPGRAQKFTVGKNEVWEALEYPGYRTVWTEKERPGSILFPLTPNCVLLSKVPHPSGPVSHLINRDEGKNVDREMVWGMPVTPAPGRFTLMT